jgi:imidazolonepropionase-like amidohydrolase
MIELFRQRGTVIDGTFNLWMQDTSSGGTANGGADAARRANANWLRLIRRLHDAGVTLVPGTDAQGSSSYVNELELYERAGIPTPEVLRMATVVPARVMGDDGDYGSIAPGKVADIVIVDGNPAQRIGDLRKVQKVMLAGRLYESEALLRALRPAR